MQETLTNAVSELVSGDDWRRAMEFATRFRSRSFNNTLLIELQHEAAFDEGRVAAPSPTYVAGYKQWLSLDRHVNQGQTGYRIFAPVTARFASATPGDSASWRRLARGETPAPGEHTHTRIVGTRPAYVWDISQTSGKPLPEVPAPELLQGQAPDGLWEALSAQVENLGFTLTSAPSARAIDGANGATGFTTHTVTVRSDLDDAARVKTLAHEVGHVMLHHADDPDATTHRGIAEVEAESFALMIAAAHNLDVSDYTIPYVSSWASTVPGESPVDVVQATAERVRKAAVRVLDRLDTQQISNGDPPGLDQAPNDTRRKTHLEVAPSASSIVVPPGTIAI